MTSYRLLFVLAALIGGAHCYPNGAPTHACHYMFPVGHQVDAQTTPAPYQISVSSDSYTPNQEITITLNINSAGSYFEGVFIQARRARCDDKHHDSVGTFRLVNNDATSYLKTLDCGDGKMNAVTHTDTFKKTTLTFIWTAPPEYMGTIYFRGTFVKETTEFWTDVFSGFITEPNSGSSKDEVCQVIQFQDQLHTAASPSLTAAKFLTLTSVGLTWIFYQY